ncbi:class I SAM-dependent methyltransferase [Inediibacterium massiliense]|uniref:class I SAM-dependent methyltransferase n=1 Tax=Inediibacterium massiliense TaxID=1658111 RepID=UPI0006B53A9B|nr:SAM-dependent methyltransferase [Inediibacterium massiliense]
MESIRNLLDEVIQEESLIDCMISNVRKKEEYNKISIRPILLKEKLMYQFTYHYDKKVVHENVEKDQMLGKMISLFETNFKQGQIYTKEADYQILISKKFKVKILKKAPTKKQKNLSHNRKKNYIIPENIPNPFLYRLGVMNEKGKVFSQKYDKFRQINRFLEMVRDIVDELKNKEKIKVIDFGCGKSYLTFALYYYFVDILNMDVDIIGLDLKEDVVMHCNEIAKDLRYEKLKFMMGDIAHFNQANQVDMVVTLHACDTATDAALVKAIEWNAKIILSVPCCQHELFDKIHNPLMMPMEKHGIIKERMSALITDSIRANILEIMGYDTQILEFIDMEHTPKNLLIRGVKGNTGYEKAVKEYVSFKEFWGITPYFEKELGEKLQKRITE